MSTTESPSIHPQRASDLARRAELAADEWRSGAPRLARLMLEVGQPVAPAIRLADAADSLSNLASLVRGVVAQVELLEMGDGPPRIGVAALHGVHVLDGIDDDEARDAGDRAWDAYTRGDADAFLRINERFTSDPRYAAAFAAHVDPTQVVDELSRYRVRLPGSNVDPDARRGAAMSAGVLQTLATASFTGDLRMTFADLRAAVDRDTTSTEPARYVELGMLFLPAGVAWGGEFLADAVRDYVVPSGAAAIAGASHLAFSVAGPGGGAVDTRVALLDQLARHPSDAAGVLATADPSRLFDARIDYADDHAAAARLLLAGTDPRVTGGADGAAGVFRWLASATPPVPAPAVHALLGRVVAPYLGSFGLELPAGHTRHVGQYLPTLLPVETARIMAMVAKNDTAVEDLHRRGIAWAVGEIDRAIASVAERGATGFERTLDEMGGIWGHTAKALGDGRFVDAVLDDSRMQAARDRWKLLASLATMPFRAVSNAASTLVAAGGGMAIDAVVPPPHAAADRGGALIRDWAMAADELKAVVVQRLWAARSQAEVFQGLTAFDLFGGVTGAPTNVGPTNVDPTNVRAFEDSLTGDVSSDLGANATLAKWLAVVGNAHLDAGRPPR